MQITTEVPKALYCKGFVKDLEKNLLEIEIQGCKAGYNPMFGKCTRKFDFAPVPYGHRNRQQFVTNVQTTLADIQYVYFGEVLESDLDHLLK